MANAHRTNVLVTSCLKTPVDPHTKAPLASYERERVLPCSDNRDYEDQLEYDDSGSDLCDEEFLGHSRPLVDVRASGEHLDLSQIFFSNEEYYSKLEELKKAHLRTMAELESMYRRKLQLKSTQPLETAAAEAGHRLHWSHRSPSVSRRLRKSHSAVELRVCSISSSSDDEDLGPNPHSSNTEFSPKKHIENMWLDFKLSPPAGRLSPSSLRSLSCDQTSPKKSKRRSKKWKHRVTVPKPFHMMLREAERQKRGIKTRSEIEHENAELKRQLEELTECQRKFRASPVPAHVHLPLFEELQEKSDERRKMMREDLKTVQKPFSFIERERVKKEQKERQKTASSEEKIKPFKAKPVPKSVYAAAAGEQMKEEQLYRSIKIQMRAQEMLHSASMPPSMLSRRLSERKKTNNKEDPGGDCLHQPKINKDIPDFDASYRRFKKHLEKRKELKPVTSCEPFELKTAQISSHRERILAEIEKEQSSPRAMRWPYLSPEPIRTPNSSLCSSLSGSVELLPTKSTSATKKRHEAVRKALERRRKAEDEEEEWREKQRQREKRLQTVVQKRAQANDPHLSLSQTHPDKLKEFRKQDIQRRKEYQQEIKEMRQRVKGRPLLLEQVAQRNAKQAAEKRYTDFLQDLDLTEDFIQTKAAQSTSTRQSSSTDSRHSDRDDPDMGYKPVHFRKVYLNDDGIESDPSEAEPAAKDEEDEEDQELRTEDQELRTEDQDQDSEDNYNYYSDDHENYSDTEQEETKEQE